MTTLLSFLGICFLIVILAPLLFAAAMAAVKFIAGIAVVIFVILVILGAIGAAFS